MDIGTQDEPGRELDASRVDDVSGGHVVPDGDAGADPLGGSGGPPLDYSAVNGGEGCLTPPTEPQPQDTNPIWKALEDAWNGIVR